MEAEFVQNQPHRRGFSVRDDKWLESELGRFCRRHKLRDELYNGALEWANVVRLYRAAWGAPMDERHGSPGMTGEGPSLAQSEAWRAQMIAVEEDLYGQSGMNKARMKATSDLVLRGTPVPPALTQYAIDGLRIVAIRMVNLPRQEHPFERAA